MEAFVVFVFSKLLTHLCRLADLNSNGLNFVAKLWSWVCQSTRVSEGEQSASFYFSPKHCRPLQGRHGSFWQRAGTWCLHLLWVNRHNSHICSLFLGPPYLCSTCRKDIIFTQTHEHTPHFTLYTPYMLHMKPFGLCLLLTLFCYIIFCLMVTHRTHTHTLSKYKSMEALFFFAQTLFFHHGHSGCSTYF